MAIAMALAACPGVPSVDGAAASGMSHGWDVIHRFSADMNKFPMPFSGAMSQMPIHNFFLHDPQGSADSTTKIPPGCDPDDHKYCHGKGMEAYEEVYKQAMVERLEAKKAKQAKEEKEAKKAAAAAAAAKEPMRITLNIHPHPHPHALTALPSNPHPHRLTASPSKPSLPDPTTYDDNVLIRLPPGLDLPEATELPSGLPGRASTWPVAPAMTKMQASSAVGPPPGLDLLEPTEPPSGFPGRASTWPVAPAMAKMRASSAVTTVPAMQRLPKTSEGTTPFQWSVETRKLHTTDKVCVSPSFEWHSGSDIAKFKMMILPKAVNDKKCGPSFKKAKGRAALEVKCEANPPKKGIKLRIAVTNRLDPKLLTATLPAIVHNFNEANICTMKGPEVDGDWLLPFETAEAKFVVKIEVYNEYDDSDGDDDSKRIEEVTEMKGVSWQNACCQEA